MRKTEGLLKVRITTKGYSVVALLVDTLRGLVFLFYRIKQTDLRFE